MKACEVRQFAIVTGAMTAIVTAAMTPRSRHVRAPKKRNSGRRMSAVGRMSVARPRIAPVSAGCRSVAALQSASVMVKISSPSATIDASIQISGA